MSVRDHPRLRGRRRLEVIRHAPPEEALVAMTEPPSVEMPAVDVSRETVGGPFVAGGQVPGEFEEEPARPALDPGVLARLQEPPRSLSAAQVLRLEALTAVWERQVRADGPPAPDATMFYALPSLPPVPPPARRRADPPAVLEESPSVPRQRTNERTNERTDERPATFLPEFLDALPARASDWSSRHDPASLEYAVRDRLRHPVPLQDYLLERGPILDQGTTPPLSLHDASACVGMAAAAAANVLDVDSRPVYERPDPATLLDADDARRVYARAQELDALSGENYAGTSVLAGMKAGQEAGWWDTYLWALGGTRDVAQAILQLRSPVVIGIPWGPSLDAPDAAGIIAPGGPLLEGHALAVVGIRTALTARQRAVAHQVIPGPYFVLQQSRGTAEGDGGLVYLHHTHLGQLLRGVGEAGVPLSRWASQ